MFHLYFSPCEFISATLCAYLVVPFPPDIKIEGVPQYILYFSPCEFILATPAYLFIFPPLSVDTTLNIPHNVFYLFQGKKKRTTTQPHTSAITHLRLPIGIQLLNIELPMFRNLMFGNSLFGCSVILCSEICMF
jgi:hypothetical protein